MSQSVPKYLPGPGVVRSSGEMCLGAQLEPPSVRAASSETEPRRRIGTKSTIVPSHLSWAEALFAADSVYAGVASRTGEFRSGVRHVRSRSRGLGAQGTPCHGSTETLPRVPEPIRGRQPRDTEVTTGLGGILGEFCMREEGRCVGGGAAGPNAAHTPACAGAQILLSPVKGWRSARCLANA